MYINFQQNQVNRSVKFVHTYLFANNRKLHKCATTNSIFYKNRVFQTCIIVKRSLHVYQFSAKFAKNRKLHKFETTNSNF